ncbi:MAG: aldolase/citrate lyase family protein [Acidobacteriota bacterium]
MEIKAPKILLLPFLSLALGGLCPAGDEGIHLNKVIAKLEQRQLVTGIWVQAVNLSAAVGIIEFNGYPGPQESLVKPMIDFLLVEMEHEPFNPAELRVFLLGLSSRREVLVKGNLQPSLAVFVRLPVEGREPVHAAVKQVLDLGVHGVVIPHVRNAAEALSVVQACRYAQPKTSAYAKPAGTRGASPWLCAYLWGLTMPEYVARADVWPLNPKGDLMVLLMIEDEEGVRNIESILKVPGLGAIIFGPYDYSFSAGLSGDSEAPVVKDALQKIKKACDRAGVPLVGFANPANIEARLAEEYRMLLIGTNVDLSGGAGRVLDILLKK